MTRSTRSGARAKSINYRGTWQLVLPENIAAYRAQRGLSPAGLGKLLGVTHQQLGARGERGEHRQPGAARVAPGAGLIRAVRTAVAEDPSPV